MNTKRPSTRKSPPGKVRVVPVKTQAPHKQTTMSKRVEAIPYTNPQKPAPAGPLLKAKGKQPIGPVDSPLDPRRTTYEKTSPQMPNTPKIDMTSPEAAVIR